MKKSILSLSISLILSTNVSSNNDILIVTGNQDDTSRGNLYENIADNLTASYSGNNSFTFSSDGNIPGNLSLFDHIWDIRPDNNFSLGAIDQTNYSNFLSNGGTLFLVGEHNSPSIGNFEDRNSSILTLVELLGGGSLTLTPYAESNDIQTITGTGNTHEFGTAASVSSSGTGTFVTQNNNGSGSIVAWEEGELANATEGALAIAFDVNFIENLDTPMNQEILDILIQLLQAQVLIAEPVIEETQEEIALDTLANQANAVSSATSNRVKTVLKTATGMTVAEVYGAPTGLSAGDQMSSGLSIWVAPSWTSFDNSSGTKYEGSTNSLIIGVDKLLNSGRTVIGATVMAEDTDIDYSAVIGGQSGTGISGSFYAGHVFTNNVILDGFIGFGGVSIDENRKGVTSDYDTDRFIAGMNVTKHFIVNDSSTFSVGASLTHSTEDLDNYTQSNGNVVTPDNVKLTQAAFNFQLTNVQGDFSPYALAGFDTDLKREGGSDASNKKKSGYYVGIGFDYAKGNMTYGAEATYRDRNDEDSFTIGASFRYSF